MADIKAARVDAYLNRPDPTHKIILIYGPDRGLVSERGALLAKKSGAALDDPFATIRLAADEAASDPQRVADEAHTVSMFGGKRLIWITGTTQKQLINAIKPVLETPPEDTLVVIEAGDLKKTSPLRKQVEASPHAVALPCFQDSLEALNRMIDDELKAAKLTMDTDARQALVANLGDDRLASRGEVQKLCLYAMGQDKITTEDVLQIIGDSAGLTVDSIIDAAGCGETKILERDLRRLLTRNTSSFALLNAAQRHFQALHTLATRADAQGQSARSMVGTARPPFPYFRQSKVEQTLALWSAKGLQAVTARIDKATLESRANAALEHEIVASLFLAIGMQAQRARNKRRF